MADQDEQRNHPLSRTLSQLFADHKKEGGDEKSLKRWDSMRTVKKSVSTSVARMASSVSSRTKGSVLSHRSRAPTKSTLRGRKGTASAAHAAETSAPTPAPAPVEATPNALFGVPLDVLMRQQAALRDSEHMCIPMTWNKLLEHLSIRGRMVEGILRMASSRDETDAIKRVLNAGQAPDLYSVSVHSLGDLLKSLVRELPEGLLSYALWADWMKVADQEREIARAQQCKGLLERLDVARQAAVTVLFAFLKEITKYSQHNRMTASNLAKVWAPNMVPKEKLSPMEEMMAMPKVTLLVETMIIHFDIVFCELRGAYKLYRTINPSKASAARPKYGKNKVYAALGATPKRPTKPEPAPVVEAEVAALPAAVNENTPENVTPPKATKAAKPSLKKMLTEDALQQRFRLPGSGNGAATLSRSHTMQDLDAGAPKRTRRTSSLDERSGSPSKKVRAIDV